MMPTVFAGIGGLNFDLNGNGRGVSVWIDAAARLDVSGLAYQASDTSGHLFGRATDGGADHHQWRRRSS